MRASCKTLTLQMLRHTTRRFEALFDGFDDQFTLGFR
jgi:hypothetical protein